MDARLSSAQVAVLSVLDVLNSSSGGLSDGNRLHLMKHCLNTFRKVSDVSDIDRAQIVLGNVFTERAIGIADEINDDINQRSSTPRAPRKTNGKKCMISVSRPCVGDHTV